MSNEVKGQAEKVEELFRKSSWNYMITKFFQGKEKVTLKQMIDYAKKFKMAKTAKDNAKKAYWNVRAILSPRSQQQTRPGHDCRGSINVSGHLYYALKLGRTVTLGIKEPQHFSFRFREVPLKSRREEVKIKIDQEVIAKKAKVAARIKAKKANVAVKETVVV